MFSSKQRRIGSLEKKFRHQTLEFVLYLKFKPFKWSNSVADREYTLKIFYFISTDTDPVYKLHVRVGSSTLSSRLDPEVD